MINHLSQLKQALRACPRLEIIRHCRKECVGEIRRVTLANTRGVCALYDSDTDHTEGHLIMAFRILDQ